MKEDNKTPTTDTSTSTPSIEQILEMCTDLRGKFGYAASIDIEVWAFTACVEEVRFKLYVRGTIRTFRTWAELHEEYLQLMNEEVTNDL